MRDFGSYLTDVPYPPGVTFCVHEEWRITPDGSLAASSRAWQGGLATAAAAAGRAELSPNSRSPHVIIRIPGLPERSTSPLTMTVTSAGGRIVNGSTVDQGKLVTIHTPIVVEATHVG